MSPLAKPRRTVEELQRRAHRRWTARRMVPLAVLARQSRQPPSPATVRRMVASTSVPATPLWASIITTDRVVRLVS